jgi:hypothetical protein
MQVDKPRQQIATIQVDFRESRRRLQSHWANEIDPVVVSDDLAVV